MTDDQIPAEISEGEGNDYTDGHNSRKKTSRCGTRVTRLFNCLYLVGLIISIGVELHFLAMFVDHLYKAFFKANLIYHFFMIILSCAFCCCDKKRSKHQRRKNILSFVLGLLWTCLFYLHFLTWWVFLTVKLAQVRPSNETSCMWALWSFTVFVTILITFVRLDRIFAWGVCMSGTDLEEVVMQIKSGAHVHDQSRSREYARELTESDTAKPDPNKVADQVAAVKAIQVVINESGGANI